MEKQKYKAILIFGPPGVGKGTQAKLLGEDSKYFHFSTGEMFRALKTNPEMADSDIGKRVNELIAAGNFVPDDLTIKLFYETLDEYASEGKLNPAQQTLILDGIPRNIAQVDLISERISVVRIINLYCRNYEELITRLVKRAEIEGRADDKNPEVVRRRLGIYDKDTAAVLSRYDKEVVIDVDGVGPIQAIHQEILKRLEGK